MNNLGRDTLVRPSCCAKSHGILVFQMTSKSYESQDYIENSGIRAVFVSLHCFANAQMLERDTRPAQEHRRLHRRVNAASVCLLPMPQAGPLRPADKNKLKFSLLRMGTHT